MSQLPGQSRRLRTVEPPSEAEARISVCLIDALSRGSAAVARILSRQWGECRAACTDCASGGRLTSVPRPCRPILPATSEHDKQPQQKLEDIPNICV
jgi:hypothetical protein